VSREVGRVCTVSERLSGVAILGQVRTTRVRLSGNAEKDKVVIGMIAWMIEEDIFLCQLENTLLMEDDGGRYLLELVGEYGADVGR